MIIYLKGASNAWDGEMKQVTKHVNLKQIDEPPVVSEQDYKTFDKRPFGSESDKIDGNNSYYLVAYEWMEV